MDQENIGDTACHGFHIDKPRRAHYYGKHRFNYRVSIDPSSCEGTGASIEIRIPILGTRFNLIFCFTDVILQPFPELTPETARKQNKGG